MADLTRPDRITAAAPAHLRSWPVRWIASLVALAATASVVIYLFHPIIFWAYNLERAGRLMQAGMVWPEPRHTKSVPIMRDEAALDEALGHLAAAARWRPEHFHAHRLSGYVYLAKTDWEAAARAFEHAYVLNPRNPLPAWEVSLAYREMAREVERAPREPLLSTMLAGQLQAPLAPIDTPYCRDDLPQTCYVGAEVFTQPIAGYPDEPVVTAPVLFMHPTTFLTQEVTIRADRTALMFMLGIDPFARSWGSDGVTYRVWVNAQPGDAPIYERTLSAYDAQQGWFLDRVDLSAWAGQTITLTLGTDPGPDDNPFADWYAWGNLTLTTPEAAQYALELPDVRVREWRRIAGVGHP